MKFMMFNIVDKKLKVLNSIVVFNAVDMVDYFLGVKIASEILLHYKAMFKDMFFIVTKRMIRFMNFNISSKIFTNSVFPSRHIFSKLAFIPRSITFFETYIQKTAFVRTILKCFYFARINFNFFTAFRAFFYYHITSKIKAAFRFLTETRLNVSTLLTADCGHKNSVNPLDINSITVNLSMSRGVL